MNILTESEIFSPEDLAKIEEHYEAKYVCETCLKGPNGWVNSPVAVFYQADPSKVPEGGSQWFGLFFRVEGSLDSGMPRSTLHITNAISAAENDIEGIVAKNGDVIYSRYRHDYRFSPDGSVMIDGGRDYTRNNGGGKIVTLQIQDDELCVIS